MRYSATEALRIAAIKEEMKDTEPIDVSTLKRCPFCEGIADIFDTPHRSDKERIMWFVQCTDCGVRHVACSTQKMAAAHWNERAGDKNEVN